MSQAVQIQQKRSNQQSIIVTSAILIALLLLLFYIKLQHPPVQEPISAVIIDFGDSKEGLGNDNELLAGGSASTPQELAAANPEPTPITPTPKPVVSTSTPIKTTPVKTVVSEDPQAVAILKQQKEDQERAKKAVEEQQRIAEIVKKAEAERAARAAEEKRIKDQTASIFSKGKSGIGNGTGNASGNGTGNGQGNSNPGGNQGSLSGKPGGDPNGNGSGDGMSYDLKGRTWRKRPLVFDNSQKVGKVVVAIKVDKGGNVVYAKYQQKGSTTTDSQLIQLAEQGAMKAKFSADPSADEDQFGTISFKFSVQ